MSILIDQNALRIAYKQETGNDRPETIMDEIHVEYVTWLEEKVSHHIAVEKWVEEKLYERRKNRESGYTQAAELPAITVTIESIRKIREQMQKAISNIPDPIIFGHCYPVDPVGHSKFSYEDWKLAYCNMPVQKGCPFDEEAFNPDDSETIPEMGGLKPMEIPDEETMAKIFKSLNGLTGNPEIDIKSIRIMQQKMVDAMGHVPPGVKYGDGTPG